MRFGLSHKNDNDRKNQCFENQRNLFIKKYDKIDFYEYIGLKPQDRLQTAFFFQIKFDFMKNRPQDRKTVYKTQHRPQTAIFFQIKFDLMKKET